MLELSCFFSFFNCSDCPVAELTVSTRLPSALITELGIPEISLKALIAIFKSSSNSANKLSLPATSKVLSNFVVKSVISVTYSAAFAGSVLKLELSIFCRASALLNQLLFSCDFSSLFC